MRENRIIVEPFQFENYLRIEGIKEINHHGRLIIQGLIADKKVKEYEELAKDEVWVKVRLVSDSEEDVFFWGILTTWEIKKENGNNFLTIELYTGTYLLDLEKHIRSFQTKTFFYSEVLKQILNGTDGKFIMLDKKDERINRFIVQYKETNWEFILRLANFADTVLIPEFATWGEKFYVGYLETKEGREFHADSVRIIQHMGGYEEYISISREVYSLGEVVKFGNKKAVIKKIITHLVGSELLHEYHLVNKQNITMKKIRNEKIAGVSLLADVVQVKDTKVQITIREDQNKELCGYRWFDYATVYSSPDGTGWYCMPESGDQVRVVFPDDNEENAYVMSSVHLHKGINNPDCKFWKNKQDKEILFTPDSLILRNNRGLSIELSDQNGISIISDKNILLEAAEEINVSSKKSAVNLAAESELLLTQGGAKIEMNDAIKLKGGKIFMN